MFLLACAILPASFAQAGEATIRETTLEIPTYLIGPADKEPPLGDEKVYPYPMQTAITRQKQLQPYRAVILENDLIQVIVLPELGGKIYAAHDKTNHDADFIYRNHVIKPGLVALRGAWTSGGIEWNFPTLGHTVNTFSSVPYAARRNPDGSVTCTVGATEWVRRMEWSVSITVEPNRSCFHNRILLANPTLSHQRAYFWVNAAVHARPDTQVVFPPTECTFSGMRRTPEPWPIRHGQDVSWHKNTPRAYDFFCGNPGDFLAAYDQEQDQGTVQCAAWHDSFGRKFFTWGTAPDGRIWDGILTDRDGPYIEIQSGRLLTQGDTWIFEPHWQEKFEEFWYPVKKLGSLLQASSEAAVGLVRRDGQVRVTINTTAALEGGSMEVVSGGKTRSFSGIRLPPAGAWEQALEGLAQDAKIDKVMLRDGHGRQLLAYRSDIKPATPELEPQFPSTKESPSAESLYSQGYHAFKHWHQKEAVRLFEKSLQRDPGFTPALRALAQIAYQAGRYQDACDYCNRVLQRNDDDDTARYYRALSRIGLGAAEQAEMDLYTVGRRTSYRHVAPYVLSAMAVGNGNLARAETLLRQAIRENAGDLKARSLLASMLRRRGEKAEALQLVRSVLQEHPLHRLALVEQTLLEGKSELSILKDDPQCYLESACDYLEMNLGDDAVAVLDGYGKRPGASPHPMIAFYLGYLADQAGQPDRARERYRQGAAASIAYVFPFRNEDMAVLRTGLRYLPDHWKLNALLGTLLAAKGQTSAGQELLTSAAKASPDDATVYRSLGRIAWHDMGRPEQAEAAYEKALAMEPNDATLYVALDRLYQISGRQDRRVKLFAEAPAAVRSNDRVLLREATCLIDRGQYDSALAILRNHAFHPWEGKAEGQDLFIRALHARAEEHRKAGRYEKAIEDLHTAMEYPENLGAGKPFAPNYVHEYCQLGLCYQAMGKNDLALEHFIKAVNSPVGPHREHPESRQKAKQQVETYRKAPPNPAK